MIIRITPNDNGTPPGKLADAELHFTDGPLEGLKLIGFGIWERRTGGGRNVTFPAWQYAVNGERRSFSLLRPIADATAPDRIREAILGAYTEFEDKGSRGAVMAQNELFARLLALGQKAAAASGGRLTVVKNEADDTAEPEPEAQEFWKLDGRRIGRDFRVYGFMADVAGLGQALADVSNPLVAIQQKLPAAFAVIRDDVLALGDLLSDDDAKGDVTQVRCHWRAIWD